MTLRGPHHTRDVEGGTACRQVHHVERGAHAHVVLTIGAESISLKPVDAVKVAEMIGEYAKQAAKGSAAS
jgi:hypothetical protein